MKKLLYFAVCMAFILSLLGCAKTEVPADMVESALSSQSEPEKEKEPSTVAICMGAIDHPVHRIVQTGFMLKAEELGMNGVISWLEEGSIQELQSKWNSDISDNNASGALIWTGDDSCYELMKELKQQGIYIVVPHFIHDYNTTKDFIDKNMSCRALSYGRNVADYITDELIALGVTNGSIGITANSPSVLITPGADGFRQRMAELHTQYEVLDLLMEGTDISNATQKTISYIYENPNMVAAFGTTGSSSEIWASAMGTTGRTDLIVVGIDYLENNMELVENDIISAIVCQPLYKEGEKSAEALFDLYNGTVFNESEDTWFEELEAPVADKDDMPYYRDIWQKMYDYFG